MTDSFACARNAGGADACCGNRPIAAKSVLLTEWNMEDALAVRFEEGWEEGREEGREEGMEMGIEKGEERKLREIVTNALINGLPLETINAITGLDIADIKRLAAHQ